MIYGKVTCMGKQKINLKDSSEFSGVLGCFYPSFNSLLVVHMDMSTKLLDKPENVLYCFSDTHFCSQYMQSSQI